MRGQESDVGIFERDPGERYVGFDSRCDRALAFATTGFAGVAGE